METGNVLSIFRQFPETKTQVKKYSTLIRGAVLEGDVDPLVYATRVAALKKLIEDLDGDILVKDVILEEAQKHGKSFEFRNAKFVIKENGVRLDYSACGDADWDDLTRQIDALSAKRKRREEFLKGIDPATQVFGPDGVQICPPVKKSTTGVSITLND
jgi:hypothetical protein